MMNLSKQIIAYIKIIRPINIVLTFIVVIVAIIISQKEQINYYIILLSSITAALVAASGNIVNDIFDIETDKISHPKRVLVIGSITKNQALYLYCVLIVIAMVMTLYLSAILLTIVFVTITLLFIYSAYLKRLPLIGNFVIALLTGMVFIYGGFAANNPIGAIVPAVIAFLINLIREIVKDIQDIEGDLKLNYSTLPIKVGVAKSKKVISLITFTLVGFTFYPFLTQDYKIEYFLIVMLTVNPLLLLSVKYLFDSKKDNNLSIVSNMLKFCMVLGLIAIYLGK